ncbi:MAG: hypothetical protein NTW96_05535 [Planctomycetia bacterium]|nr:hypothetical protein [Planctomycetia bacterium]
MNRLVAVLLLCAASLALQTAAVAQVSGDSTSPAPSQPVTVLLSSGRVFVAEIDGRTDESDLWLRWRREGISLFRPVRWERVTQVEMAGRTFPGDAVRRAVVALRQNAPDVEETKDEAISLSVRGPANPSP